MRWEIITMHAKTKNTHCIRTYSFYHNFIVVTLFIIYNAQRTVLMPLCHGNTAPERYGNTQRTKHTRPVAHHSATGGPVINNTT